MQKDNVLYANSDKFDDIFNTTSQPAWKAAAVCPFCAKRTYLRMCGEYTKMDYATRSGQESKNILIRAQVICKACGATGPVSERDIHAGFEHAATNADFVTGLYKKNKMLMLDAAARWNRRYAD